MTPEQLPCDVHELTRDATELVRARAAARGLRLVLHIAPRAPRVVTTDPTRVRQILINLLSNAVKFTPENGQIRVEARMLQEGYAMISVADTGVGMSPSEVETAMRPFGQIDTAFNKRHEGTGLGLPIAYALARLHGGDLHIESQKAVGTRVSVILPTVENHLSSDAPIH